MKPFTIITAVILLSLFFGESWKVTAQTPGEWTWMHGDATPNSAGVFGVQGVASAANKPPGLYEPCEWRDNNGNFWLLGGANVSNGNNYSALWKFDPDPLSPTFNQWTWMKGPSAPNQPGVFGVQGVPSAANYPAAPGLAAASWVDASGNLWLCGGAGGYNDLWKYDPNPLSPTYNQWTWMKGFQTNIFGSYGVKGTAASTNLPRARDETSCTWTDNAGNLWLYGGQSGILATFGDLWKYTIASNNWTWMHGANPNITINPPAVYGIQGVPDPANTPGGRMVYSSWTDLSGNLWLFGGGSISSNSKYNDLWKYDPTLLPYGQWTWMKGPGTANDPGNYGVRCVPANSNIPPARLENRARVRDSCGNFWEFGGFSSGGGLNDLWHYNVSTAQWIWVSGDNIPAQAAVYGVQGVSAPANKPGARYGSVAWIDKKGYIWVFGGDGGSSYHNDLFRYVPDPACVPTSGVVSASPNTTICVGQSVTLSATGGTSYVWSPGGQSTSSIVITPSTSITYTVTGTGSCGSGNAFVTITVVSGITAIAGPSSTICAGQNTTLTASGGSNYSWSNGQTTSAVIFSPTATTTYSVVVSNGNCSDTAFVIVNVTSALIANAGPDVTICAGDSTQLSASGGTGYSWTPSAGLNNAAINNPMASPAGTTTYTVIVSSGNCAPASDVVTVVVSPNPIALAWSNPPAVGQVVTITAGNNATLSASGGGTYSWNNGTTGNMITVSPVATTIYCVTVTDAGGCTADTCITVFVDIQCGKLFLPNAFSPNGDKENDEFCLQGGTEYCIRELTIVIHDRWGEQVYQSSDKKFCWDGIYQDELQNSAVFVYYLDAILISGQKVTKKGNLSLIR